LKFLHRCDLIPRNAFFVYPYFPVPSLGLQTFKKTVFRLAGDFQDKVLSVADGYIVAVLHCCEYVKSRLHGISAPEKGWSFGTMTKHAMVWLQRQFVASESIAENVPFDVALEFAPQKGDPTL
jgi:hypothetical protein